MLIKQPPIIEKKIPFEFNNNYIMTHILHHSKVAILSLLLKPDQTSQQIHSTYRKEKEKKKHKATSKKKKIRKNIIQKSKKSCAKFKFFWGENFSGLVEGFFLIVFL